MNVLIIGSGGREHAIAWKISKSSMIKKLIVCPGNAGTELVAQNIRGYNSNWPMQKSCTVGRQ